VTLDPIKKNKNMKIVWIFFLTLMRNVRAGLAEKWAMGDGRWASLANEAKSAFTYIGLTNALEQSEEWVQIAPQGQFEHSRGIQLIDDRAGEAMVNHFGKLTSKLARRFVGVPFYIGHPDHPDHSKEFTDKKAYGWVNALEWRKGEAGGLFGKVEWSAPGKELLANGHYKFLSPHWNAETQPQLKFNKPVFRPVELVSVGLTNQPNLPVNALANEAETESKNIMEKALLIALLGLANEANEEQIKTKITSLVNTQNEAATVRTSLTNEQTAHATTKTGLENQFKAERKARIELLVNEAIRDKRIPAGKKDEWITALETDFAGKSVALANEKKAEIKTESRTGNLGGRRVGLTNQSEARQKVEGLINEKTAKGLNYDVAWNQVKREQPALFAEMTKPEPDTE
jgi:phage I-like protein